MTKKREALQKRLDNVKRWTDGARKRMHNASKLYRKRCQQTKERADALYRILNDHQREMERQGVEHWLLRKTIKEEKAVADAEIEEYQQRQWKAYHTSNKEFAKCEKYCREQRELLRAIEDLQQQEREMYELENHKDQVMTVCKVALANLVMWVPTLPVFSGFLRSYRLASLAAFLSVAGADLLGTRSSRGGTQAI